jgi:hemerythrin-like metal-binding protein
MMQAFVWDDRFVTGLDFVDEQHHHLVDVINRVGDILLAGNAANDANVANEKRATELQTVFKDLAAYARRHFQEEEQLMAATGLDPRHIATHKKLHHDFIEQLVAMWRSRESMARPADILHGFLAAWLTVHILGIDHAMARQVAKVKSGEAAAQAYADELRPANNATSALLSAMEKLYYVLSIQNRDLAEANLKLEDKVAARTADLEKANANLQEEREELRILLQKVDEAQSQLLQSEKMASIGQLAAGVAHEINNPVGFVSSNLGTLKTYVGQLLQLIDAYETGTVTDALRKEADLGFLRQDIADLVKESQDGLDRVKKIVSNLKDFSHVDEAEWQDADLNAGLESTLNVVWNEIKYKATVVREFGNLPPVRCIPAQINQVVMNLLVNAAQAIEQQGTITMRSGVAGNFAWIEVADTGKGMLPEVRKRIFEPFYTTKPVGKGTGLGLSLSYDIVAKHGGSFTVSSEAGQGSTFHIDLPMGGPDRST